MGIIGERSTSDLAFQVTKEFAKAVRLHLKRPEPFFVRDKSEKRVF